MIETRAIQNALPVVVRDLSKSYGDVQVVKNLSFEVSEGEVLALWGDNGAGKSTVLKCLLGLLHHEGEVEIGGWSVTRNARQAHGALGHVSQEPAFHSDLTVDSTLDLYGRIRGANDDQQREALHSVGLDMSAAPKKVSQLSGGMRRKLAVAVALLGRPRVLLLDEPTANLDQRSRHDLILLLQGLKRTGISMLLASHQPDEVVSLADRVLHLKAGELGRETTLKQSSMTTSPENDGVVSINVPRFRSEEAIRILINAGIPMESDVLSGSFENEEQRVQGGAE